MMKQTIEIEVPDGKKAVWKEGKVVFEDLEPKLPKTWEEFCKQNKVVKKDECFLNNCCYIINAQNDVNYEMRKNFDRNILPNKKAAEQHLALMQLHQLRDCYRQGWVPNWNNENEERYSIHYIIADTKIASKFLTFQSVKIAREFLNNFKDLIKQAGDLI